MIAVLDALLAGLLLLAIAYTASLFALVVYLLGKRTDRQA